MIRYTLKKKDRLRVQFEAVETIEKNFSQAYQDMLVLSVLNGKRNGTYLEIGAYHSSRISNTWLLESKFGWNGLSFDIKKSCVEDWKENRKGKFLLQDATTADYDKCLQEAGLTTHIDYLQLDIDPSHVTYEALLKIPFEKYSFSIITFETDYFRSKDTHATEVRKNSREYIQSKGYVLIAGDICPGKGKPFEDWYVSKEIAESEFFRTHFEIKREFNDLGENYVLKS